MKTLLSVLSYRVRVGSTAVLLLGIVFHLVVGQQFQVKKNALFLNIAAFSVRNGQTKDVPCFELQELAAQYQELATYRGLVALGRCDRPDDFLRKWGAVLQRYAADPVIGLYLGNLYSQIGEQEIAIGYWRTVGAAHYFLSASRSLLNQGDIEGSLEQAKIADVIAPINHVLGQLYQDLGMRFLDTGDMSSAIQVCNAAIRINPSDAWSHYVCGLSKAVIQSVPDGILHLKRAVELEPHNFWFLHHLGRLYFYSGDRSLAIETLRAAAGMDPQNEASYRWIGYVYLEDGTPLLAIESLKIAVELAPEDVQSWAYLLQAEEQLGAAEDLTSTAIDMLAHHSGYIHAYAILAQDRNVVGQCPGFVSMYTSIAIEAREMVEFYPTEIATQFDRELVACKVVSANN